MRDVIEFGQLRTQGLAGLARPTKIVGFPQPALQDPGFQAELRDLRFPVVNNYLNDLLGGRDLAQHRPGRLSRYARAAGGQHQRT